MGIAVEAVNKLKGAVGADFVSTEAYVLHCYAKSVDPSYDRMPPAVVVKPKSTEEVVSIVNIANKFKIPIVPRGCGADLTAGARPTREGMMVVDFMNMDRIELDIGSGVVNCQPGVTWGKLVAELGKHGLYTGQLGPANSSGSLGGSVSNESVGGGGETMFGSIGDCITSLEIVLPNGKVITTGAAQSNYSKPWYGGRYVGGPDLTGMFIGDPGLLGIKTGISLRVHPMPPFWKTKTYLVPGNDKDMLSDLKNVSEVFMEWERSSNFGIFGMGYWNYSFVNILGSYEIFSPWAQLIEPGKLSCDGALAGIVNAWTEEDLLWKFKSLEVTLEKRGCKVFGDEISEGNWARWMLEKTGNWSYFHPAWGVSGAGPNCQVNVTDACWPDIVPVFEKIADHYGKNVRRFLDAKMAMSYMLTPVGGGAKIVIGYPAAQEIPEFETRELRRELIEEQVEILFKNGALPIWTGPSFSHILVDAGIIKKEYLDFLKGLKDHLDPNGILSPGKFHFNE
jgi:hypothetical protein